MTDIIYSDCTLEIFNIYASQHQLRNIEQIEGLVCSIQKQENIPRITLIENENGKIWVVNGHHRLVAYILCGRYVLYDHEYLLIPASYNYSHIYTMDIILDFYENWLNTKQEEN